jgi:GTPase SAR1 family protein/predicted type IV restriction endonuclease
MQATFESAEGERRLRAIIEKFPPDSPHWNEAQNRFQFVDRILTEVLGWQRPYIEVENTDELGGRSDYLLGRPAKAVLEVKREAVGFSLPATSNPNAARKIEPILKSCKNFRQAFEQVIPYCAMKGAPIAIVCNGPQLVIFQSMILGVSPADGECFVFDGYRSYIDNFSVLWSFLSPEGIFENRAGRDLSQLRNPRIPPKASFVIAEPKKYRYRNSFKENLRILAGTLLEDIEENPAVKPSFYRECYVPIDANNKHLLLSKKLIAARYARVSDAGASTSTFQSAASLDAKGNFQINDPALVATLSARPIVVVGDVGVGKTSFFENLFEHLDASERANTYFIHVNLGIKANLRNDIKAFVIEEISKVLKQQYGVDLDSMDFAKAIYHADLADFDKSVRGAMKGIDEAAYQKDRIEFLKEKVATKDNHLHASLGHLAHGRNKQIILVLDNADQRDFQVQQQAFLIAQELAATRNLLIFVSLRPSTFYLSKTTGALSGYQNRILTIAPPPADEVMERRIAFAVRVAEGHVAPAALEGIRLHLRSIVLFLRATLRAIRSNNEIKQFLDNITGGNSRAVVELVAGFCGSPNVDSEKIVEIEGSAGDYRVPLHEFTKHALLGDYAYFNPLSSTVACNIFDVVNADPREHFLASLIIMFLSSGAGARDHDGFAVGSAIVQEMAIHGFRTDQVTNALRRLATKRLIETPHAHFREIPVSESERVEDFHFRVTSIGIYHVRFWTGSFSFLDATSTDTPMFEEVPRQIVCDLAASFDTKDRLKKATEFRDYLERQWYAANIHNSYYDFPGMVEFQSRTFEAVTSSIAKANKPSQMRKR